MAAPTGLAILEDPVETRNDTRHIRDHEVDFIPKERPAKRPQPLVRDHVEMQGSKERNQAAPVLVRIDGHRHEGRWRFLLRSKQS